MQPNIAGLDLFGGLRNFITSPFSGDDGELDGSEIADIQNRYNDQRATNRKNAADLGFDGEYRPNVVTKTDAFEGTVAQLRAKVDKIDLDAVNDLISAWNEISTRNSTSLDEFRKQITRGMAPDVWSGAAATAAGACTCPSVCSPGIQQNNAPVATSRLSCTTECTSTPLSPRSSTLGSTAVSACSRPSRSSCKRTRHP